MNEAPTDLAGYDPTEDAGDCEWDRDEANRVLDFFARHLRHPAGKLVGKPYEPNPWERDFLATVYGWKRPDGTRRYREAFVGVPRKNNKTTMGAGMAIFSTLCEMRPDGEFDSGLQTFCAAADKEQASLVFKAAAYMVAHDPQLAKMCKVLDAYRKIDFSFRDSFVRAIPADARRQHGFNASTIIVDEMHTQPDRDLYDVLKTSQAARAQPLTVSITTAGHDRESICWELWSYGQKVRRGEVRDPYFLPVIYEAVDEDDWKDRDVWRRVNPNFGRSVQIEYLEEQFKRALVLPAAENSFRNLHLNMWTESEDLWVNTEDWDACKGDFPDLRGLSCIAGLDLGATNDLTALVYVFPCDGKYFVKPHFFCPTTTIETCPRRYQNQYRRWVDMGLITVTEGSSTDYEAVRQQIYADAMEYDIEMILFDQWQAADTQNQLQQHGLTTVRVTQGYSELWPGVKACEEAVYSRDLVHDGNEVMKWMVSCTHMHPDSNGNRKPDKLKSHGKQGNKGKIDGVVAMVMAMSRCQQPVAASPYDDRGLLTV